MRRALFVGLMLAIAPAVSAQVQYDLLLQGGHVIDPRNGIDAVRDVAIKDGLIAVVAADIPAKQAFKTVSVKGLYVTPGLIDIHAHVFPGLTKNSWGNGDWSVYADGFTLRSCVTTVNDAGGAGWRTFDDFKERIVAQAKTRVTAFLNIVGAGMVGDPLEQDLEDMEVEPTLQMALKHKGLIVGIKTAHFNGPEWSPYERAVEVGRQANIPVMVDFGSNTRAGRSLHDMVTKYLRPGDLFTHVYTGSRGEQDPVTKGPSAAALAGRARGVLFDVGHGGGAFRWATAVPMVKAGFLPDSISTDLHVKSMNAGMKDMLNVMGKFLALGVPLNEVILRSTWNPAKQIQLEQLGHLSVGAPADVAVIGLERGAFGFADVRGGRLNATQRLTCEVTIRDGKVIYDLNGTSLDRWDTLAPNTRGGDPRWYGLR
ncbi:MAG: amidohydrolase/deacetylase family metallohydrolase [Dehalococcoidia bacterium]